MSRQQIVQAPRFKWWHFGVVVVLCGTIFVVIGLLAQTGRHPAEPPVIVAYAIMCASILGFSAYRFHRLRVKQRDGQFSSVEFRRDPFAYFRGPSVGFGIWLVCTVAVSFGFLAYLALKR